MRWFLSHGADPNVRGRWDVVLVTIVCYYSTLEVVDLLVSHGASLYRSNALHLVAEDEERWPRSVKIMSDPLDLGMDVNETSHYE